MLSLRKVSRSPAEIPGFLTTTNAVTSLPHFSSGTYHSRLHYLRMLIEHILYLPGIDVLSA